MDISESSPIPSPDPKIEAKNVQVDEEQNEVRRAVNSPKVKKDTWMLLRAEFEAGTYLTLKDLAKKYKIAYQSLKDKMYREDWNKRKTTLRDQVLSTIDKRVVKEASLATKYLSNTFKRALRLEKIADASLSQASLTNEGIPLVDLEQLDVLTRSETRIHELAKSALRIIPVSQVDHTTNGQGFGESFVSAIAKLRSDPTIPKLGEEDLGRVLDAEIVD